MYMTLIVIIDEHSQCLTENHYVGSMSDIKTICNVEPDVTLSIYEWCIDNHYYSVFYLENDTSDTFHDFPPPLSTLYYDGNIVITMSPKSLMNETDLSGLLHDVTRDEWNHVSYEICGVDDDVTSESSIVSDQEDMYESFYNKEYDSTQELSEEEYNSD